MMISWFGKIGQARLVEGKGGRDSRASDIKESRVTFCKMQYVQVAANDGFATHAFPCFLQLNSGRCPARLTHLFRPAPSAAAALL